MDKTLDLIVEILKYCLPIFVVYLAADSLLKNYFINTFRMRKLEFARQNQTTMLPMQLQAYERLILYLERIAIDSLIQRHCQANMTATSAHNLLTSSIKSEFEHNLVQQLYVSTEAWKSLINAKNISLTMLENAYNNVEPNQNLSIYVDQIVSQLMQHQHQNQTQFAIKLLSLEVKKLLENE